MIEMSTNLSKKIKMFCKKLTFEYPRDKFNGKSSHMMGSVPDDIEIDRTKGNYFVLYGKYYWDYLKVLEALRDELSLEYLKDNELKNALWHFICEIIAGYSDYLNTNRLNEKIDEFLSSMLRPLEEYEVLIPILHLDANDLGIKMGDVTIKKFDELALQDWGILREWGVFKSTANKTMAIIPEKGNNPELICDRARRKADFIIRILQVSLSTDLYTRDENLLFKQEVYSFYRKRNTPSSVRKQWQSRYEFPPLVIDERLEKRINNFLGNISDILEEEKYPPKLRERFERALMWIGRSIEEEDPDIKIVNLSTALETILTDKSEGKKGEQLAYRMLLVNAHVKKPFIDPAKVLRIYELRSEIIHGSRIGIASDQEYSTMKFVAIETLRCSLEIIRRDGLKKHKDFINAIIESYKKSEKYLFSWDDLHNDGIEKLIRFPELLKFLMDDLDIDWAESAEIYKTNDRKTIRITKEKNSAEIKIDEEKEKATLKISDGISRALKVKKENGKLNIYRKTIQDWLEEQGDKRSLEIKKCMENDLAK